jgi:membrane protease YdiL (CAAX protease family)
VSRYSRGQLFAAKTALVALAAIAGGFQTADDSSDLWPSILVLFAGLGAIVVAYEAGSRAIALLLGRIWKGGRTPDESSAPPTTASPGFSHPLGLRHVMAAFAGYLAGQALVWLGAVMVVAARLRTGADEEAIMRGIKPILPAVLPASVAAGGLGALWAIRSWGKRVDPRDLVDIVALRRGTRRQLLRGGLAGAALGLVALVLMPYVPYSPTSPDLMDELLSSPGPARWSWILSAVILAPPIEELVFRGVLLGGLAKIWNLRTAAVVSGVTFWAMHAPEWSRYWPAAVAIALMTVIVTTLRIWTRALGPSIVAHSAYNLLMASVVLGVQPDGAVPETDGPKWAQLAPDSPSPTGDSEGRLGLDMDLGLASARALARRGGRDDFEPKPFQEISDADWLRFSETHVLL